MKSFVDEQPIYDVHEHHMPEILRDRDVGLLDLLTMSYAGWTQERRGSYPLNVAPLVERHPGTRFLLRILHENARAFFGEGEASPFFGAADATRLASG